MSTPKEDVWIEEFVLKSERAPLLIPLIGHLQDAAGHHAASFGLASDTLRETGVAWVLAKFHIKLFSDQENGKLKLETWRAGIERIFAARDFRVKSLNGDVVAEATSYWAVFDLQKRRAVPVSTYLKDLTSKEFERVSVGAFGKPAPLESPATANTVEVNPSHQDANQHVNNLEYMYWIAESVTDSHAKKLTEIELFYKAEARLGDRVVCKVQNLGNDTYLHLLTRESDGLELVNAKTVWKPRTV